MELNAPVGVFIVGIQDLEVIPVAGLALSKSLNPLLLRRKVPRPYGDRDEGGV